MKRLIWCILLCGFVVGCGTAALEDEYAEPSAVQVMIAANDFEIGTPRIPLVLLDGLEPADASAVMVTIYDLSVEPPAAVWTGDAVEYADYELPYWVVQPEIETAGAWGLQISSTLPDGTVESYERSVMIEAQSAAPNIGDRPPASYNRTAATHDIATLTSGNQPNPALYQMTVADALTNGRPTVVTFATPAFCTTKFCAPVLHSAEKAYQQYGEQVDFIHLEIFKDFQTMAQADEVIEWALASEPWTYVIDADGVIASRMGGPVSPDEITAVLESMIQ